MSWTSPRAAAEPPSTATPQAGGSWPEARSPILDWLVGEARLLPNGRSLLLALCERLVTAGLPLARASFHVRVLHPQLIGIGYYWQRGSDEIRVFRAEHGIQETSVYQQSPMRILFEGAGAVRQRLDLPDVAFRFPLFYELRDQGLTDYVALPVTFSDGKVHGTTWSSDRPGGFTTGDLAQIYDLLPALSLLLEIYLNRRIAITLLDTYVGRAAGERILRGQITRGSGETVRAAIWFCDLRGFTELSERTDRDALLACLNQYFDSMAGPVEQHGGEILKFIGDAMLAVFPLDTNDACRRALQAALDARAAMAQLNRQRLAQGEDALGFGIALHTGDVMYGNIGTADRLDFTVIGPAVNLTSRLEGLCRALGLDLLVSDTFAGMCACADYRSLGTHRLIGIARPVEVFTVPEAA
ncbi:MAG TPA: adenylate/guanylate cyclase domain-containing protein [Geminicoccaceae bacterium]|jgi:adenylate cyclase|nr:adenylate/guanylate cyclase domain-containing protein [Geminicoccaceae bacterium]